MTKPFIIGFYGYSNTGKTTLIVDLVRTLSEKGFKVSTIKQSNKKISFDMQKKDTYCHSQAGANPVVLSSASETDFIIKKKLTFDEIIKYLVAFEKTDVILVEGVKNENIPKIRIGDIKKRENTILTYDDDFEKLYDFIEKKIKR